MHLFMDRALARRTERVEAAINASFIEARARIAPESGATWTDLGGTYLLFDGRESPVTQTFGLGLWEPVTGELLSTMEAFFFDRGADVFHESRRSLGGGRDRDAVRSVSPPVDRRPSSSSRSPVSSGPARPLSPACAPASRSDETGAWISRPRSRGGARRDDLMSTPGDGHDTSFGVRRSRVV
jgi:hypothetical protein